jgi:hypothetical protein
MLVALVTRPDGSQYTLQPAPGNELREIVQPSPEEAAKGALPTQGKVIESPEDYVRRIATRDLPAGTKFEIVESEGLIVRESPASLKSYADVKLALCSSVGISVEIGTKDAPLTALVDTSAQGKADVISLQAQVAAGAKTVDWFQSTGRISITPDQLNTISAALADFSNKLMQTWQHCYDGIQADPPTIVTRSQVDEAGWPS